jgi:hypothetical protein
MAASLLVGTHGRFLKSPLGDTGTSRRSELHGLAAEH